MAVPQRLQELASEFETLRVESAQLRERLKVVQPRLTELRPLINQEIVEAARTGVRQAEIVKATGYTRERIRQICRQAGIEPAE